MNLPPVVFAFGVLIPSSISPLGLFGVPLVELINGSIIQNSMYSILVLSKSTSFEMARVMAPKFDLGFGRNPSGVKLGL